MGGNKGTGVLDFAAGAPVGSAATPALTIRGLAGGTSRATINLGFNVSGSSGGNGRFDFTGRYVDVLASTISVGKHDEAGCSRNKMLLQIDPHHVGSSRFADQCAALPAAGRSFQAFWCPGGGPMGSDGAGLEAAVGIDNHHARIRREGK